MKRAILWVAMVSLLWLMGCQGPAAAPPVLASMGHGVRATKKPVVAAPAVADLDGDGLLEIAVGAQDGYFYLLDDRMQTLPGWPRFSRGGFYGAAALVDLDDDGTLEILAASDAGRLHAWHKDGSDVQGWPVSLGYRAWAAPTILPEKHVAIAGLRQMLVYTAEGLSAPGWPQPQPEWSTATAAVAPGLLAVTTALVGERENGALCAWRPDGTPYEWSPLALAADSSSSPVLGDLNGDGALEIVFGDDAGWVHIVTLSGESLDGWPQQTGGGVVASPALGDLNGDGRPEVVVASVDGGLYVWDADGSFLPGWPMRGQAPLVASPALADLDGDGATDVLVSCRDGNVYGWNARGERLAGFPISLGSPSSSSLWVGELIGGGRADIVVGADDGLHLLRDVGAFGLAPWPQFHRDRANSGYLP